MNNGRRSFSLGLLALALTAPLAARAETDQQMVVDRAQKTIADLSRDKAFGNARQLLHRARAVLIVPRLIKGGFIVGGEGGTGVMLVMTQKGLDALLRDQFKFGAQAGIAVATLGSGVEGAIGGASPPDIVVWSSSSGVYAGISLDGSVLRAQPDDDRAYYGRPLSSRDILFGRGGASAHAAALRRELAAVG